MIFNLMLFLLIIVYEFVISISPIAPPEPAWTFMNIKTTANSLSRSNQFNLFVIFFDALIVVIFDPDRSKYVMITKKQKRSLIRIPLEQEKKISRLWRVCAGFAFLLASHFIIGSIIQFPRLLFNIILACLVIPLVLSMWFIICLSSKDVGKTFYKLLMERRIVIMIVVLGVLFYVDNFFLPPSVARLLFPFAIFTCFSFDVIGGYFPKRMSLFGVVLMTLILLFNILNHTFLKTDCEDKKLEWGVFGEKISYCTIKRLIYQTILSLLVSPFTSILMGRTDNLFFCNANVSRSTGTIGHSSVNTSYLRNMMIEQRRSNTELAERLSIRTSNSNIDKDKEEHVFKKSKLSKSLRVVATGAGAALSSV